MSMNWADTRAYLNRLVSALHELANGDYAAVQVSSDGRFILYPNTDRQEYLTLDQFVERLYPKSQAPSASISCHAPTIIDELLATGNQTRARDVARSIRDVTLRQQMIDKVNAYVPPSPTAEGLSRFQPDGLFLGKACTCKSDCPNPCRGNCGCLACQTAYRGFSVLD